MIKHLQSLPDDVGYVPYDIVLLLTNITLDKTIHYITESIYNHKKLPQLCSRIAFRILLEKMTKDCTFQLCFKFINK